MAGKRVLVIDDDNGIREIIQVTLEIVAGWEVITASSGKEGIVKAQKEQPDLIILDFMMPELDGKATFKQLQANTQTHHIPTIFLTAREVNHEEEELMSSGITGIIHKPFDPPELVRKIEHFLHW
ncbi:response regulator receiver protein [Gloeothece citriformis PCC 7424]|uniref:Response regulator receiver protein n=1 Tax=Gloeothece citriformis (strain PCC 7424) TaxID=65393 RepID=B7KKZ5_GLOC7|nr:response regulator [Gloeothece citriformis]ACK72367.1 response regulator receiver protein [Gloeothece citriformis PCC 7424]